MPCPGPLTMCSRADHSRCPACNASEKITQYTACVCSLCLQWPQPDAKKLSQSSTALDCSRGAALMQLLNVHRIRFNPKYCVSDSAISGEEVSTWKPPHTRKDLPLCHELKSSNTLLRSPQHYFSTLHLITATPKHG